MADTDRPKATTLGELRASGWVSRPVKQEVREHAIEKVASGEPLFAGVSGYEDTVMPQLENALLAGHDVIFLGERGQAKTRMIRSLTGLLDEWMPIVAGSEINDDPYQPVSKHAATSSPNWVTTPRSTGCTATALRREAGHPDTSIADLIGEVDPIKVAEGRYLSDELTLHYGLVPARTAGSSPSTSCPTSPSASRSACSTCSRSATSRSAATRSACRST
jgi:magnesium chelatase subunit I